MSTNNSEITHVVPAARLARYQALVGPAVKDVEAFYLWAQALSLALFADIASLEVAMRSAMARELSSTYGPEWYRRPELFDDDAARSLSTTWGQQGLSALTRTTTPDVLEGKLVAGLMFGFWVQLLGRGSHAGKPPLRQRRIYDTLLWKPALRAAFPNAAARREVERHATVVRAARNRIAHHEHITWGIPIPGQNTRMTVGELHTRLLELAAYISPQTAAWILATSTLAATSAACPVNPAHLSL